MTTTFPVDNRNILDEADSTSGWTATDGPTLFTAAPDPIEATGCLAMQVSNAVEDAYTSITSDNYSQGGTLSIWMQDRAAFETTANVGIGMVIGDGFDRIAYAVGGSDGTAFRHDEGPVKWACFLLDPANLPLNTVVLSGTLLNLTLTAITQVGVYFETIVKSVGGADNCFWDIIRWADPGDDVVMQGGTTSGAAGNAAEATVVDRATATGQAYGVIRELGSGLYGIQGNLTVGNSASATDQYWEESIVTYAWEDRGLSDRNYYRFNIVGRTGQTSSAIFTSTTFTVPSAANARFDGNGADMDVVTMDGCTFIGFDVGVVASDDTGDDWTNGSYIDCGPLEINGADHTGSTFSGTLEGALVEGQDETSYGGTATEGGWQQGTGYAASDTITLTNGAIITVDAVTVGFVTEFTVTTSEGYPANEGQLLEQASTSGSGTLFQLWPRSANLAEGGSIFYDEAVDPDGELDDMTFTMGADDTHAAVFGPNIPAEITLRGWSLTGYNAADSQPDSMLHFLDTTGTITVNIIDGPGAVSYKSEGATIDIVISPVTTKVTCEDQTGALLENVRVFLETSDNGGGTGLPYQAATASLTQAAGTATCTTSVAHGLATNDYVVIRGANVEGYNKQAQITVTSTTVFTYTVDSGLGSPAGGTPVVSYCPISGLTATTGIIQSSKSWPASQGLSGWARKSTSSPYFKTSPISVADASGGTDLLVLMLSDE